MMSAMDKENDNPDYLVTCESYFRLVSLIENYIMTSDSFNYNRSVPFTMCFIDSM